MQIYLDNYTEDIGFFLILEEFHSTIGLIRKNRKHVGGLLGAR